MFHPHFQGPYAPQGQKDLLSAGFVTEQHDGLSDACVKWPACSDDTHHGVGMTAKMLRSGIDDHVRTERQGFAKDRRGPCVVENDGHTAFLGHARDLWQIADLKRAGSGRFDHHRTCVFTNLAVEAAHWIEGFDCDIHGGENAVAETSGVAVKIFGNEQMSAGCCQGQQR